MNALFSRIQHDGSFSRFVCTRSRALIACAIILFSTPIWLHAQGTMSLYGDLKVEDKTTDDSKKPLSLTLILYNLAGIVVQRQTVPSGIRYRFNNLRIGEYYLAVEVETTEIARVHIVLSGIPGSDYKQDLEFEWKSVGPVTKAKASTISATDVYKRTGSNESLFVKAQAAVDKKKYEEAEGLFKRIVESDGEDFQAWTELGTTYLLQNKPTEAENAYVKATQVRPTFALAFSNLGRLRSSNKKFEEALDPLMKAIELQPNSGEVNLLLGEVYLQLKKGSKAVIYLTEAARLGKPDAYLRLASLYNAVGMKDKAAAEYEEYLKKNPNYPEKKKLEQYIQANKPKSASPSN